MFTEEELRLIITMATSYANKKRKNIAGIQKRWGSDYDKEQMAGMRRMLLLALDVKRKAQEKADA